MQVMPREATGHDYGNGESFADRPPTVQLLDPKTNLIEGCKDLRIKTDYWGSIKNGLVHYGPMYVGDYYANLVIDTYNIVRQ